MADDILHQNRFDLPCRNLAKFTLLVYISEKTPEIHLTPHTKYALIFAGGMTVIAAATAGTLYAVFGDDHFSASLTCILLTPAASHFIWKGMQRGPRFAKLKGAIAGLASAWTMIFFGLAGSYYLGRCMFGAGPCSDPVDMLLGPPPFVFFLSCILGYSCLYQYYVGCPGGPCPAQRSHGSPKRLPC